MKKRVLIVEDDRKTSYLIQTYLERDGYRVSTAFDGEQGLKMARENHPDLVILDLMLPRLDGLDLCRLLRSESSVPIIMLTARTTEEDKLRGLDLGADDYVTKPFSPRELVARARAVLRRALQTEDEVEQDLRFGDITINFARHEVLRDSQPLAVTPTEFKLLAFLAHNPGRVFTRLQLIDQVLGLEYTGFERTIDVHMMNLRRKIEPDSRNPTYIKTVFGIGYKLEAPPDAP